jgi:uncharacterized protein
VADIFADTAGWGHLVDPTQKCHDRAAGIYRDARRRGDTLVTTNYVLMELAALLTNPLRIPRTKIVAFVESLKTSPHVAIVHVDSSLDERAWQLFADRHDKEWSLVDCASFIVMRQRNLLEALTTDRHFEQAGFSRLLKT